MNTESAITPETATATATPALPRYGDIACLEGARLMAFYALFRFCLPDVLPLSLRDCDWHYVLWVCFAGGLLFAVPKWAALRAAAGQQAPAPPPSRLISPPRLSPLKTLHYFIS